MLLAACSADPASRNPDADATVLRVRAAHLTDYAWMDRDGNGQPDNLKPGAERNALIAALMAEEADVMLVRGLGSQAALEHLAAALRAEGGGDIHAHYIPGTTRYAGAAVLARQPPRAVKDLSAQTYRVRNRVFHPLAGGVQLADGTWLWNAVLPEPDEDYERRRNEARLLAQALRPLATAGEPVLLTLHSREGPDSPLLRMFPEAGLDPVVPVDENGDAWTYRDPDGFTYETDQWVFATPAMVERIQAARLLDSPGIRKAGTFRHQWFEIGP